MSRPLRLAWLWLTCFFLASGGRALAQGASVNWRTNVDAAKVEASQTGKLLLLHFWTPSCAPCRVLDEQVFTQPEVMAMLERDYVPVKVNADTSPALRGAFRIRSVPTDVILTPQGTLIASQNCPPQAAQYRDQLTRISAYYQQTSAAALRGAAAAAPNAAYAGLDASRYQTPAAPPAAAPPVDPRQVAATPPQPAAAPQVQTNPYLTAAAAPAAPAAAAPAAPDNGPPARRYEPPFPTAAATPEATAATTAAAPAVAAPAVAAPIVAASAPAASAPAAPAVAASTAATTPAAGMSAPSGSASGGPLAAGGVVGMGAPAAPPAAAGSTTAGVATPAAPPTPWPPQLPEGVAPLAFDGYCPVSLKKENRWVRGDVRFGRQHRGRTYLFASSESMEQFVASPDDYSPVFNGMDPVALLDENRAVEGTRRFGFKHRGLFYLFASAESMKRFESNPDAYAAGVRQAMARLDGGVGGKLRR